MDPLLAEPAFFSDPKNSTQIQGFQACRHLTNDRNIMHENVYNTLFNEIHNKFASDIEIRIDTQDKLHRLMERLNG